MPSSPIAVPPAVIKALYKSLLKESQVLDKRPILKVLFPIPVKLQSIIGSEGPLYIPNGVKYTDIVRRTFRETKTPNLELAFDALNRLKVHNEAVGNMLPSVLRDHDSLISALKVASPPDGGYWARPIQITPEPLKILPDTTKTNFSSSNGNGESKSKREMLPKALVKKGFDIKVGMGLIAHPLSSSHVDRRVMVVVEKNQHITTAIVLDMLYSYPLSHGNPMFPEVFWGHEVYNGGYCHVDFTMPPTANVAILHTLDPPRDVSSNEYKSWLSWVRKSTDASENPAEHHSLLCTPIIEGGVQPDGSIAPTLYYSKAEALGYLSNLAMGKTRSSVRIYWGVMKWATHQIQTEVMNGHWIPVDISPKFFSSYSFLSSTEEGAAEYFPTEEELKNNKKARVNLLGADVTVPQTFPPNQPLCRRESLWDQILYSLGGEYKELIGMVNPFSQKKSSFIRVPPVDLLPGMFTGDDSNDDDDE